MKTHNGYTRLQFAAYLRHTLIPDLVAAEMTATAEDFETALQFICEDAEVMHDARKALQLVIQHTPANSDTETLCCAVIRELDEGLDPEIPSREELVTTIRNLLAVGSFRINGDHAEAHATNAREILNRCNP